MKTKAPNTENNDNTNMFAFMPDMVLEHLNHAKPKEFKIEPVVETPVQKITIFTDPEIPELDSFFDSFNQEQKQNKMY